MTGILLCPGLETTSPPSSPPCSHVNAVAALSFSLSILYLCPVCVPLLGEGYLTIELLRNAYRTTPGITINAFVHATPTCHFLPFCNASAKS